VAITDVCLEWGPVPHVIETPRLKGILRPQQCIEVVGPEVVAHEAEDRYPGVGSHPVPLHWQEMDGRLQIDYRSTTSHPQVIH
jgi:hypothetical protein